MQCEYGSTYNQCGTTCQKTCFNKEVIEKCEDNQCIEGCFCPSDMVMDQDGKCVYPADCPCKENGIIYFSGQKFSKSDCQEW